MAKLAVDKEGREWIFAPDSGRSDGTYFCWIEIPKGTIKKIIGKQLKINHEPYDLWQTTNKH